MPHIHAALLIRLHVADSRLSEAQRAAAALKGIEGKRLTYRRIGETQNAWAVGEEAAQEAEAKEQTRLKVVVGATIPLR